MASLLKEWVSNGLWLTKMMEQAAWGLTDPISNLGPGIKGIEIGIQHGCNSLMLIDACPNISKIIGIDPFVAYQDWDHFVPQRAQDEAYALFKENLPLLGSKFEHMKMHSIEAASHLKDDSYDFVFIDADHSLNAVLLDLEYYVPKVKKGGIVAGHDVGLQGVNLGIQTWCKRKNIPFQNLYIVENQAWYYVKT